MIWPTLSGFRSPRSRWSSHTSVGPKGDLLALVTEEEVSWQTPAGILLNIDIEYLSTQPHIGSSEFEVETMSGEGEISDVLTNLARPKTSATLTLRVIKSFEYRTEKSLVLHEVNLEETTVGRLKEIAKESNSRFLSWCIAEDFYQPGL